MAMDDVLLSRIGSGCPLLDGGPLLMSGPAYEILNECPGCTTLRHEVADLRRLVDELRADQPVIR